MFVEAQIEKKLADLQARGQLPLAIELWNGQRFAPAGDAPVTLRFPGTAALKRLANPDLAALGEAYVEGEVDIDGPIEEAFRGAERLVRGWGKALEGRLRGRLPSLSLHTRKLDSEAIKYHYDVSNDFYRLWLDAQMVYSCAYFRTGSEDIDTAQAQKLDHICRKLQLAPGDRLLDIGCGWGALVCHAAMHYGVHAQGLTLSEEQFAYAKEKVARLGLQDKVTLELRDFASAEGGFDKIASIGMFEHVSTADTPNYFRTIHRLLKPGGLYLHHAITIRAREYERMRRGKSPALGWIRRYIFPGGEASHVAMAIANLELHGFEVHDIEAWREHYARTTRFWHDRLAANRAAAEREVGEVKTRLWLAYLAGSSIGFARGSACVFQTLASKRVRGPSGLPSTRADLYGGRT